MNTIVKWLNIFDVSSGNAIKVSVRILYSGKLRIISASMYLLSSDKVVYGRSDLDYHAYTTVAGENLCILQYTVKECNV